MQTIISFLSSPAWRKASLFRLASKTLLVVILIAPATTFAADDGNGVLEQGVAGLMYMILKLVATVFGIVGLVLDQTLTFLVVDFGQLINGSSVFFDLWNLTVGAGSLLFIGAFMYMILTGFLDLQNFQAKRTVPMLLFSGVFMYMSFFITGLVVDVSGAITNQIYRQAVPQQTCEGVTDIINSTCTTGLSGAIAQSIGISSLLGGGNSDAVRDSAQETTTYMDRAILWALLSIILSVALFVFLSITISFVIRAVVLMLALITAPLGFLGLGSTLTRESASRWWTYVIGSVVFAPIALFFILLAIKVGGAVSPESSSLVDAFINPTGGNGNRVLVVVMFGVIAGLMLFGVKVAKSLSESASTTAVSLATLGLRAPFYGATVATRTAAGGARALAGVGAKEEDKDRGIRGVIRKPLAPVQRGLTLDPTRLPGVSRGLRGLGAAEGVIQGYGKGMLGVGKSDVGSLAGKVAPGVKRTASDKKDNDGRAVGGAIPQSQRPTDSSSNTASLIANTHAVVMRAMSTENKLQLDRIVRAIEGLKSTPAKEASLLKQILSLDIEESGDVRFALTQRPEIAGKLNEIHQMIADNVEKEEFETKGSRLVELAYEQIHRAEVEARATGQHVEISTEDFLARIPEKMRQSIEKEGGIRSQLPEIKVSSAVKQKN